MSPTHRMRKLKIGQQKFQYAFFQILFEKRNFKLIETPFMQNLQSVKNVGPKGSTSIITCMAMCCFAAYFPQFFCKFCRFFFVFVFFFLFVGFFFLGGGGDFLPQIAANFGQKKQQLRPQTNVRLQPTPSIMGCKKLSRTSVD